MLEPPAERNERFPTPPFVTLHARGEAALSGAKGGRATSVLQFRRPRCENQDDPGGTTVKDDQNRRSGPAVVLALVILLFPIAYVLSIGPAARLADQGHIEMSVADAVYFPLKWLHDHTPLRGPLEWYVELWVPGR